MGKGSQGGCGNLRCHDCQRMCRSRRYPLNSALHQGREYRASRLRPPTGSCLRFRCKKDRAQEGITKGSATCLQTWHQECGAPDLPSRPAGLSEVRAGTNGKTRTGCWEWRQKSSPTWHQNRASSKNKTLICTAVAPASSQQMPNKKLGRAGTWPPSGQCTELRKASLQDTEQLPHGPAALWRLLHWPLCSGPCPQTCHRRSPSG